MSQSDIEQLLRQLVAIKSVSGSKDASTEVIKVINSALSSQKGLILSQESTNGFPHLIATSGEPDNNTLWFVCHLDVVPAKDELFELKSDENNYYGRGVFDMKGMAAALISAVRQIDDLSDYNFGLIFTTDEEVGGKDGVGSLVKPGFKGGAAFVPDASSDWVLQEKMKGVIWLEIISKGLTAHGSRPWLGKDANLQLINYLHEFSIEFKNRFYTKDPNNYYSTLNIGKIKGGEAVNQVSDHAEAQLDIRYVSKDEAKNILGLAKATAEKYPSLAVNVQMQETNVDTDTNEKWFQLAQSAIQELGITPGSSGERLSHGSTDGRYLAEAGIPVISTRSPGGDQHSDKEWASIEGLNQMEKFCQQMLNKTKG